MNNHDSRKITYKQKEVYQYILDFKTVNGISPTISEIAIGTMTSRTYARECVHALEEKGFIRYNETKRRSIMVLVFDKTKIISS